MSRRCGCSDVGAKGPGGGVTRAEAVASPSVASSKAVPTAPRTSSRSERLDGRPAVIEGNMCSQGYGGRRTERVWPEPRRAALAGEARARAKSVNLAVQRILHA